MGFSKLNGKNCNHNLAHLEGIQTTKLHRVKSIDKLKVLSVHIKKPNSVIIPKALSLAPAANFVNSLGISNSTLKNSVNGKVAVSGAMKLFNLKRELIFLYPNFSSLTLNRHFA